MLASGNEPKISHFASILIVRQVMFQVNGGATITFLEYKEYMLFVSNHAPNSIIMFCLLVLSLVT